MSWKREAKRLSETTSLSWRKIAKKLGIPKSTVSDYLRGIQHPEGAKFLFIDTETSMILAYVWDIWKQNVNIDAIVEDWYFLCFSANWMHSDKIISHSLADSTGGKDLKQGEYALVEHMWELLDEADIICAYNGKKFDKKRINAKFLEYGLSEPSPYQIVDPYLIVRGNFDLTSNKMDYVAKLLDQEGKIKTNLSLWLACMNGDRFALAEMQEYCDQDVWELKDVYNKVRAWDKNHPNMALYYDDEVARCNTCGSDDLGYLDGVANTSVSSFSTLRCKCCGKIMRDRVSTVEKKKRKNLYMNVR